MKPALDIVFIGILFISNAVMDLYLILAYPDYALKVFGATFSGLAGEIAKFQSPILHTLIGYGFIRLRRWSYFLFMGYAVFGLVNAGVNFAVLGYGWIRTLFVITLALFVVYIYFRRDCFLAGRNRETP